MERSTKFFRIQQILIIAVITLVTGGVEAVDEWEQWRGPNRDGIVKSAFPKSWPEQLTKQWEIKIGEGHSSPVVWENKVYTFTREGDEEVVRAIEIATGKVLWRSAYPAPYNVYPGAAGHGAGPKSTPVFYQNKLFTLGISGILSAFDARSGKLSWQKKFDGNFHEAAPPFGASMSPLVAENLLIAHVGGHKGGALKAFEVETGAERWSYTGEGPSYSSPILIQAAGVRQIVAQAHRKIISVNLSDGKLLWSIPFVTPCDQNIVTPLAAGDLLIFSSLDTGTFAVRVLKNDAGWSTKKIWEINDVSMYMSSPLYVNGKVIGMSHRKQGQIFAVDAAAGSILWTSPPKIAENAAFLGNDQSILMLKDDGELQILDGHANKFEPVKTYNVSNTSTWAHPAPVSSGLIIKNHDSLSLLKYDSVQS